jgi:hypothetical protein
MNLLPGDVAGLQKAIDEANAAHFPKGTAPLLKPPYEEIIELLREIRDALKPKPRGRPKQPKP